MKVHLAYGRSGLDVEFPDGRTSVITPSHVAGLPDERAAFLEALRQPIAAKPLASTVRPEDRICIVFSDITRATPNERIIPWLLAELERCGTRRENITLLNGLGTHRPNTKAELEKLLTPEVVANYRVVNHEPTNPQALARLGITRAGNEILLNRHLVEADVRLITGFIEPHFFAGFSGGPKGVMPGVAGQHTVERNHGAAMIGHPNATWGVTFGNPLWEEILEVAQAVNRRLFLVNVTLNDRKQITRVFAGDLVEAHRAGCAFVKQTAMQPVDAPFEVVVTTNSGYPLDLNLYQAVKGMSAAARIVRPGGAILIAAECSDAQGRGGPFYDLLQQRDGPDGLLELINSPGFCCPEQWQVQIQALIQKKAAVSVYSSLPPEFVRRAHLTPCADIAASVRELLARNGGAARVAVLPLGPLTIPYLRGE
ncbi:MAG: nickel-dependent lactate racemase [Verrucomicrobia bacterium]|nr:nickel-dependent lactate racemase [Verrucomicrobiota bacterium]